MDEFERQLRAGFDRSRSSYLEAPDPFAWITQSAKRRRNRRRAGAAVAGACVAALIAVPLALVNLGGSSDPILDAALTWSARPHGGSGASHVVTGPDRRSTEGDGETSTSRPKGASDGTRPGIATPGGSRSTAPGTPGSNTVTNPPPADGLPNSVPPGGTSDGGETGDGTTDGSASDGGETGGGTSGGTADGATPDAPELNRVSPSIGSGETSANLGALGAPACGGPSALDVGEVGVFTAPDRSAEPFSWAPSATGAFDVVLDGPAGVVCASAVTVGDVDLDAGAGG
ncbi:MAG: hypothetical protein ACXW2Y_07475 [Acidimicrobiia bacterium]